MPHAIGVEQCLERDTRAGGDPRFLDRFCGCVGLGDSYAVLAWVAEHAAELGIDPERIAVGGRPDVPVLSAHQLVRLLWRLEPSYTPEEAAELAGVAGRASTWRDRASVAIAIPAEGAAFGDLERTADAARRRRTVLESTGLAAVVAAMIVTASGAPAAIVAAFSSALAG